MSEVPSPLPSTVRRWVRSRRRLGTVAGRAGFWTAVCLPVSYLPFVARGIDTPEQLMIVCCLLAVNVLALMLGRNHLADRR
jgi:hypothetical protein